MKWMLLGDDEMDVGGVRKVKNQKAFSPIVNGEVLLCCHRGCEPLSEICHCTQYLNPVYCGRRLDCSRQ
jgi:hypothetical protein